MKIQVKKLGTSEGLILPKEFKKFYGIKVGDWIDMSDVIIISDPLKKIKDEQKNGMERSN
jgi:antitoxin component of MazEF toxin-antitoxin module